MRLARRLIAAAAVAMIAPTMAMASAASSTADYLQQIRTTNTDIDALYNPSASQGPTLVLTTPAGRAPSLVTADVTNRMSMLYVTDPAVRDILGGSVQMQSLPWIFRQEPTNSGPGAQLGVGNAQRMNKISGSMLADLPSGLAISDRLKAAIDATCTTPAGVSTCAAHLVGVDEIGAPFGDPVKSRRLDLAMTDLTAQASPWGGTYASRVHFYLAPGVSTAIAVGLGTVRNLGNDGKQHWPNYSRAMIALSKAGGVWMEMYHHPNRGAGLTPFSAAEWRDVPAGVASFLKQLNPQRSPLTYLHFLMAETQGTNLLPGAMCSQEHAARQQSSVVTPPPCVPVTINTVCPSSAKRSTTLGREMSVASRVARIKPITAEAAGSMRTVDAGLTEYVVTQPTRSGIACQWQRAQSGAVNTRILMNGPAAFRVTGTEATTWGALFRQFFILGSSAPFAGRHT